ncbi:hypothetical protein V6Z11_D13G064700 [Gossypium hirsutum]|uniref:Tristetraprolin-like n=1 Tax=Gossypium hirsutum TaxID=3635 RepID=A0A1U8KU39_GOSHI|nr:mRNA decay activator protein ZFP36-like [Gossypium hirsutum]XP_040966099.1 mRNA decay activator protein ZFP36-like [Gossypium hirsutum]
MDSFYKVSNKLNVLNSNIPKLMLPARSRTNYYSSPENLIKYLRSNSLSSSGNNSSSGKSSFRSSVSPQSEKTPVKVVEEDVLVMDGVLVASDTNIAGSGSSSSPGSVGFYKSEISRTWEEFGHCRYGSKCQFAHGKEEVRPSCFSFRSKPEAQMYKSYASTYGSISRPLNPIRETAATIAQKESSTRPDYTNQRSSSTMKPGNTPLTTNIAMKPKTEKAPASTIGPYTSATNGSYWSPQDDGINVTLPSSSPGKTLSRADIDAYIDSVLYGPTTRRRLPVFSAFSPQ